jgi:hypothetical protein
MKTTKPSISKQRGAISLLTSLALLIGITLVTLLTAKAVLIQTQNTANDFRMAQALAAANAAMDYAVAYLNQGGPAQKQDVFFDDDGPLPIELDHTENGVGDYGPFTMALDGGATANFFFRFADATGPVCGADPMSAKTVQVVARGFSDDGQGQRTITQCVGTIDLFGRNGPKQPLVAKGAVGLTGNYQIINRFNNTTIWSGDSATIGMSASAATYLREQSVSIEDLTKSELEDIATNNDYTSEPITDRNKGTGVETIDNDPRLGTLEGDAFFNNFLFSDRATIQAMAAYTTLAAADGQADAGIVWVEGDASMNGGTYGSPSHPAIIVIDGNLSVQGNPEIYGMLYVAGQMDAAGTPTVYGTVLVEGDPDMVPAGELPVVGNGTVNLVYTPYTLDQAPNPIAGTSTIIPGSWRDW